MVKDSYSSNATATFVPVDGKEEAIFSEEEPSLDLVSPTKVARVFDGGFGTFPCSNLFILSAHAFFEDGVS